MSLRPPSTSPSPSPGPHNSRASLQPPPRSSGGAGNGNNPATLSPIATRQNAGTRPTSELLSVGNVNFQTPEAEAIDQWFENLRSYEATLEDMAAASLDANFKEELSAIEQWFRVLSEAERTAALYSLLQHSTQVQIRFFITVLQQMARSDPMTALLSPAVGSSMQAQMEAKLASMGLKSPAMPNSPSVRNFAGSTGGRQSVGGMDPSGFLSPDSASGDAASTLAQQRARLKANNSAHRLSAPGPIEVGARPNSLWTQSSLTQVAERAPSPATSDLAPIQSNIRPKSTDFTGLANQMARSRPSLDTNDDNNGSSELEVNLQELRLNEQLSPIQGGNWASMVNTPLVTMFPEGHAIGGNAAFDTAAQKLQSWSMANAANRGVVLDDAKKFRRESKGANSPNSASGPSGSPSSNTRNLPKDDNNNNNNNSANKNANRSNGAWRAGARSPAMSSTRYGSEAGSATTTSAYTSNAALSPGMGLGMGMGGFGGMYNGVNLAGMHGIGGMPLPGTLESQILAAQLGGAFSPTMNGGFPVGMGMGNFGGMMGMGVQGQPGGGTPMRGGGGSNNGRGSPAASRTGFGGPTNSNNPNNRQFNKSARPAAKPKAQLKEEDINETLLNDVPAWFHVLRLHKYTPVVSGKNWRDLVVMDDKELETLGITALGARRKLLKHFVLVRDRFGIPHPEGHDNGAESDGDDDEQT